MDRFSRVLMALIAAALIVSASSAPIVQLQGATPTPANIAGDDSPSGS